MTIKVLTPQMGAGVDEVTVVRWLKKEGDSIKELEPLVEVETDKVITEIPSPADGILLNIMVLENATSQVGETLAEIGTPEE
ncbi:MAG: biotin/lipoyl-containing protein, partial [Anaerolineaceae bacterium]